MFLQFRDELSRELAGKRIAFPPSLYVHKQECKCCHCNVKRHEGCSACINPTIIAVLFALLYCCCFTSTCTSFMSRFCLMTYGHASICICGRLKRLWFTETVVTCLVENTKERSNPRCLFIRWCWSFMMALKQLAASSASPAVPVTGRSPFDDVGDQQLCIEPGLVTHHDDGTSGPPAEKPPGLGTAKDLKAKSLKRLKEAVRTARSPEGSSEPSTPSAASTEPDSNPALRQQVVMNAFRHRAQAVCRIFQLQFAPLLLAWSCSCRRGLQGGVPRPSKPLVSCECEPQLRRAGHRAEQTIRSSWTGRSQFATVVEAQGFTSNIHTHIGAHSALTEQCALDCARLRLPT